MSKRGIVIRAAAVLIWACLISIGFALAADADINRGNFAFVLLDGIVMFIVGGLVIGVIMFVFGHRIQNRAGLFAVWAMIVAFIGLGNFAAWMFL